MFKELATLKLETGSLIPSGLVFDGGVNSEWALLNCFYLVLCIFYPSSCAADSVPWRRRINFSKLGSTQPPTSGYQTIFWEEKAVRKGTGLFMSWLRKYIGLAFNTTKALPWHYLSFYV